MPEDQKTSSESSPFEIVTPARPKKFSPKSLAIIIIVVIFLGISVFLGVYLVQQRTNVAEHAAPATAIYVTPGSQTKAPGSSFTFSIDMDTSTNAVTGVDVRLTFNPAAMQIVSLSQGSGITNLDQTITNTYDNTAGTISYAVFTLDSTKAVSGTGVEVLRVSAKVTSAATAGNYNIAFDPATAASASQEGQNVLISKSQGVLVVSGGTPTPTPTGTPTPTPTATATSSTGSGNSCNGTCGSNTNCASGLYCYSGSCRNPSCASDSTCGCGVATPTPTAQSSPLPIPVTGTDWPTMAGVGIGVGAIVASLLLAI